MKRNKDLIIKKSRNGNGIFSARDFLAGEKIFEVTGTFMTGDEDDEVDEKTRANAFRYDSEKYISPNGEIGDFLNHSCEPNSRVVKSRGKLFVVAVNAIAKSAEIVIDYSTIIAPDDSWEMDCNCGSGKCRGTIGKFNSLPKRTRQKYVSARMVPHYILG